jgi:hypothetical protein
MANLSRQSIDQEFRQDNYQQNSWGIQNAQSNKMVAANDNRAPQSRQDTNVIEFDSRRPVNNQSSKNTRRKRIVSAYQGANEINSDTDYESPRNQRINNKYYSDTTPQANTPANLNTSPKGKLVVNAETKATATLFLVITNSWSMAIWVIIQFWAGLISSLFFGLTAAVTYTFIGEAVTAVAMWFGYTEPNLLALGFWGLVTAALIGWVSLFAAAFHAKTWLLHPLLGRGTTLKTGAFLLALVMYAIPLLNMIPWIMLWAWTVKIYPK